jgi:hypothetical protein
MGIQEDILKCFQRCNKKPYGAKFFKADLHFHTPGSGDARWPNRYDYKWYDIDYPKDPDPKTERLEVKKVQEAILVAAKKTASDIVQRFLDKNLSLVAITDHNGLGTIWSDPESKDKLMDLVAPTWYELISREAQKIKKTSGKEIIILPGIEISTTGVHILAIFPIQDPPRKVHFMICDLLFDLGFQINAFGDLKQTGEKSAVDTINMITQKGAIAVPAHIDAGSQAMLNLFELTSLNMGKILKNPNLGAVEIVNPNKFLKYNTTLKKTLKEKIDDIRTRAGLPGLAYLQGSDAHDLTAIAKRFSLLKMTKPSFKGMENAFLIPSSRVRISQTHTPPANGLYVHSIEIHNKFFKKEQIRFNRHLNCIVGKKDAGKSFMFNLIQACVNLGNKLEQGSVSLFMEQIKSSQSNYYSFSRTADKNNIDSFFIDNQAMTAQPIPKNDVKNAVPKFYNTDTIEELITSKDKLSAFLKKHFNKPDTANIKVFNDLFSTPEFLKNEKSPLLAVENDNGEYKLLANVKWGQKKSSMKDFFKLSLSQRRTFMMCMIIIKAEFGPAIIDAPEENFDNEDIVTFLVPIIKLYKDFQQVILFTNNPLLAINTDPDNYILIETKGAKVKEIHPGFSLDDEPKKNMLLNILEGNMSSFNKRVKRYT